jgi:hypothetical protein
MISNQWPNDHLKLQEKQEQANPKTNRREIIKIRAEINEIEKKKSYKALMKQKGGSLKKQIRSTDPSKPD